MAAETQFAWILPKIQHGGSDRQRCEHPAENMAARHACGPWEHVQIEVDSRQPETGKPVQ